ncbi:hypothetical protein PS627_01157 [Pseudomonas fluorescens]|uniref:hypothetical protein n=1 Tax=Pseudomonas fluorescens TaxID=294 RepID=UPI001253AAA8|nr:hypothetical protein [Pseudomonas fluorescens]CAG8865205.1 hypothetical protein PS627_01157 [Pseudomonas fluorescens]VVQ05810.1 hypothetical protein PS910_04295 [Pseudomonas fluorescens]
MKKIVPDPPFKLITSPYFSIHSDIIPPDALALASELLQGIAQTIDEHCRSQAGKRGLGMLSNASHSAETARALVEHALARL